MTLFTSHSREKQSPSEVDITLNNHVLVDKKWIKESGSQLLFTTETGSRNNFQQSWERGILCKGFTRETQETSFLKDLTVKNLDEKQISPS